MANAGAALFKATKELERWQRISRPNSNALMGTESCSSAPEVDQRLHIDKPEFGWVREWQQDVIHNPPRRMPPLVPCFCEDELTETNSIQLSDNPSVFERRPYERVRGKQWINTQIARERRFRKRVRRTARSSAGGSSSTEDSSGGRSGLRPSSGNPSHPSSGNSGTHGDPNLGGLSEANGGPRLDEV